MNCSKILDLVYEYSGSEFAPEDSMPLFDQIQVWLHSAFCPYCTREIEGLEEARNIMRRDFFASSAGLEDSIMAKITAEKDIEPYAVPGGISTRAWAVTGLIILVSLAAAFFGLDFQKIADETGISFLLPVGITIGIVLTAYCVFFIGSHIREFTERFDL
jgi:hypothetical protein